jgi:ubiquinone/menaquinone biosynthesis C-methylase UbiE
VSIEEAPVGLRSRFFAFTYDRFSKGSEKAGLAEMRRNLIAGASGDVLEIGGGTGANLGYYGAGVESLTVTEPEPPMLKRLERKAREQNSQAVVLRASAEDLPFEDASFDTVVSTLVLCGVDDQPRVVRELRRVLRPGGRLIFIEHVRSDDPRLAKRQDRMTPVNRFVMCCDCNRPTLETIRSAGFEVTKLEQTKLPKAPALVRPLIVGTATAPVP